MSNEQKLNEVEGICFKSNNTMNNTLHFKVNRQAVKTMALVWKHNAFAALSPEVHSEMNIELSALQDRCEREVDTLMCALFKIDGLACGDDGDDKLNVKAHREALVQKILSMVQKGKRLVARTGQLMSIFETTAPVPDIAESEKCSTKDLAEDDTELGVRDLVVVDKITDHLPNPHGKEGRATYKEEGSRSGAAAPATETDVLEEGVDVPHVRHDETTFTGQQQKLLLTPPDSVAPTASLSPTSYENPSDHSTNRSVAAAVVVQPSYTSDETRDSFVVTVHLPHVSEERVHISLEGGCLTVRAASSATPPPPPPARRRLLSSAYPSSYLLRLSTVSVERLVDMHQVKAQFTASHGLVITFPKKRVVGRARTSSHPLPVHHRPLSHHTLPGGAADYHRGDNDPVYSTQHGGGHSGYHPVLSPRRRQQVRCGPRRESGASLFFDGLCGGEEEGGKNSPLFRFF